MSEPKVFHSAELNLTFFKNKDGSDRENSHTMTAKNGRITAPLLEDDQGRVGHLSVRRHEGEDVQVFITQERLMLADPATNSSVIYNGASLIVMNETEPCPVTIFVPVGNRSAEMLRVLQGEETISVGVDGKVTIAKAEQAEEAVFIDAERKVSILRGQGSSAECVIAAPDGWVKVMRGVGLAEETISVDPNGKVTILRGKGEQHQAILISPDGSVMAWKGEGEGQSLVGTIHSGSESTTPSLVSETSSHSAFNILSTDDQDPN